ncbi:hypothetical protein FAIPA1_10186 [Frankia sp. AiPs1]
MGLHLSQVTEADELLTNDPLALLIGMVLDQQVSERWSARPGAAGECLSVRRTEDLDPDPQPRARSRA